VTIAPAHDVRERVLFTLEQRAQGATLAQLVSWQRGTVP
jgi:hypothetical protein